MAKCKKCGKKGLFLELYYIDGSEAGLCLDCFTAEQARLKAEAEAEVKGKEKQEVAERIEQEKRETTEHVEQEKREAAEHAEQEKQEAVERAEQEKAEKSNNDPPTAPIIPISFPEYQDGHPLQHSYYLPIQGAPDVNITSDILAGMERIAPVTVDGDKIEVTLHGKIVGWIEDVQKAKMLADWEIGGYPAHAILRADGKHVNLRFYRDKTIGCESMEQTVVKLKSYHGEEKQLTVSCLSNNGQLQVVDEYGTGNNFLVLWDGQEIGVLPAAAARRFANEGLYNIVVDHVDEKSTDSGDFIYIPYVRIYWNACA